MECANVLIDFFSMVANWAMVTVTIGAAAAAFYAARYAKGAWKSQLRQEAKARRQLKIALNQEQRLLRTLDRERRIEGPFFEPSIILDFRAITCGDYAIVADGEVPLLSEFPNTDEVFLEKVHRAFSEGKEVCVYVVNRNSRANLRGWRITRPSKSDSFSIFLHKVYTIAKASDPIPDEKHSWLFSIRTSGFPRSVRFTLEFETESGYLDSQIYQLSFARFEGRIYRATMERLDPTGITPPDIGAFFEDDPQQ